MKRYDVLSGYCTFGPNEDGDWVSYEDVQAAIDEAVAKERESCLAAVLQEHLVDVAGETFDIAYGMAIGDCAAAIRARSKK